MKIKEIVALLEKDGWYFARQKGSHKQYKHPLKPGLVTIPFHGLSDEAAPGTLASILKQAQLKEKLL